MSFNVAVLEYINMGRLCLPDNDLGYTETLEGGKVLYRIPGRI